jgi:eukaryotic-like serine/threonine-protein kinase
MSSTSSPPASGDERTRAVPGGPPLDRTREAVPVLADTPPDADADLKSLLDRRLRQTFFILAAIYAAFLARQLVLYFTGSGGSQVQAILLGVAFGVQSLLAAATAVGRQRFARWMPVVEWVALCTLWTTQGLNQFAALCKPDEVIRLLGNDEVGQVLTANTWLLPWFAVIAGYPVLVPNTVRRTVVIVGVTAALPVVVTVAASVVNPELTLLRSWMMYVQFVLWGLVGASIAVYGATQAALLRKEAFEAKKFGQYRLVRKLGAGGMGEVHLAEHQLLRRPSVIKLVRADRRGDVKAAKRFEREVKMLATLTHWNTVEVYDYGHTPDGTFYFVMEYLPGVNLDEFVREHGPLPPGRTVFLMRQVCLGLREAHRVGLIHRDIKPANIMACERGGLFDVAKLLDFGLGRTETESDDDRLTREGVILGTPAFLSPEQAGGKPTDARSDVYSLGTTLYYLLTGKPVFDKSGGVAMAAAHLHETPTAPPGVPADLAEVVLKCLAKDLAARFQSVKELEQALASCGCAADWDHDRAEAWWKARP